MKLSAISYQLSAWGLGLGMVGCAQAGGAAPEGPVPTEVEAPAPRTPEELPDTGFDFGDSIAIDSVTAPLPQEGLVNVSAPRSEPPIPGWPVGPAPLPGAILPHNRIVAYYGNPLSTRMGILGEIPPQQMLARLDEEVAAWEAADPGTPVVPALHLVAMVAQADPGSDGDYSALMSDETIEEVASWAETRDALVFLDLQVGLSTVQEEIPRIAEFLKRPNFHLGLDPEFSMKRGNKPGTHIGTLDASDINFAIDFLGDIVDEYDLPPKVLVIHRFTQAMITNAEDIRLDPRVQVVIDMDGWGAAWLKERSYQDFIVEDPVQFTGIKLFYKNDTRSGNSLMTPEQILDLMPAPVYIQYQ
ncbi:MAG TPA: hypothetical protein VFI91_06080 [Longimicrobiaceae bacterium]|nr:hypothetical protein [Longimicrobiaceae bacterium]